jgi:hypothetical protein
VRIKRCSKCFCESVAVSKLALTYPTALIEGDVELLLADLLEQNETDLSWKIAAYGNKLPDPLVEELCRQCLKASQKVRADQLMEKMDVRTMPLDLLCERSKTGESSALSSLEERNSDQFVETLVEALPNLSSACAMEKALKFRLNDSQWGLVFSKCLKDETVSVEHLWQFVCSRKGASKEKLQVIDRLSQEGHELCKSLICDKELLGLVPEAIIPLGFGLAHRLEKASSKTEHIAITQLFTTLSLNPAYRAATPSQRTNLARRLLQAQAACTSQALHKNGAECVVELVEKEGSGKRVPEPNKLIPRYIELISKHNDEEHAELVVKLYVAGRTCGLKTLALPPLIDALIVWPVGIALVQGCGFIEKALEMGMKREVLALWASITPKESPDNLTRCLWLMQRMEGNLAHFDDVVEPFLLAVEATLALKNLNGLIICLGFATKHLKEIAELEPKIREVVVDAVVSMRRPGVSVAYASTNEPLARVFFVSLNNFEQALKTTEGSSVEARDFLHQRDREVNHKDYLVDVISDGAAAVVRSYESVASYMGQIFPNENP